MSIFAAKTKNIRTMIRKTALEERNRAVTDLFLTLDPETFEVIIDHLIRLRRHDKDEFSYLLGKFDELKLMVPPRNKVADIFERKLVRNRRLNRLLCTMLFRYWDQQDLYQGGFSKRNLPVQDVDEPDDVFMQRYNEEYNKYMEVMLEKFQDYGYIE